MSDARKAAHEHVDGSHQAAPHHISESEGTVVSFGPEDEAFIDFLVDMAVDEWLTANSRG